MVYSDVTLAWLHTQRRQYWRKRDFADFSGDVEARGSVLPLSLSMVPTMAGLSLSKPYHVTHWYYCGHVIGVVVQHGILALYDDGSLRASQRILPSQAEMLN
jgi:hypothetical protein